MIIKKLCVSVTKYVGSISVAHFEFQNSSPPAAKFAVESQPVKNQLAQSRLIKIELSEREKKNRHHTAKYRDKQ